MSDQGMPINDYQERASETANYPREHALAYIMLGLNGEAGEVADKYKKVIRDNDGLMSSEKKLEIAKELGDVLWYVAMGARELGFDLEFIAKQNIDKLQSRKERGKIKGSGDNR